MGKFHQPDLGRDPDDPFARDGEGSLSRRAFWLGMSDRSLVLARLSHHGHGLRGALRPTE